MKTCPNPKCNMSGIPDDAKFCPKCGKKITIPNGTWDKQYIDVQKERDYFLQQKQLVELFEERRKRFFEVMSHDKAFILEKKAVRRRKFRDFIVFFLSTLIWVGEVCLIVLNELGLLDELVVLLVILSCLFMIAFLVSISYVMSIIKNGIEVEVDGTKLPPMVKTFINENFKMYKSINSELFNNEYSILKKEINNCAAVTDAIMTYKNNLDLEIKKLDEQLRTFEQLRLKEIY